MAQRQPGNSRRVCFVLILAVSFAACDPGVVAPGDEPGAVSGDTVRESTILGIGLDDILKLLRKLGWDIGSISSHGAALDLVDWAYNGDIPLVGGGLNRGVRVVAFAVYASVVFYEASWVESPTGMVEDLADWILDQIEGDGGRPDFIDRLLTDAGVLVNLREYLSPGFLLLEALGDGREGAGRRAILDAAVATVLANPEIGQRDLFDGLMAQVPSAVDGAERRYRAVIAQASLNLLSKVDALGETLELGTAAEIQRLIDWSNRHVTLSPRNKPDVERDRNHHYWVHALYAASFVGSGSSSDVAAKTARALGSAYEILTTIDGSSGLKENGSNATLKDLLVNAAGARFGAGQGGSPSDRGPDEEERK